MLHTLLCYIRYYVTYVTMLHMLLCYYVTYITMLHTLLRYICYYLTYFTTLHMLLTLLMLIRHIHYYENSTLAGPLPSLIGPPLQLGTPEYSRRCKYELLLISLITKIASLNNIVNESSRPVSYDLAPNSATLILATPNSATPD